MSAVGVSVSVSVALLLPGAGSVVPPVEVTVAVLLSEPVALGDTTQDAVYETLPPTGKFTVSLMLPAPAAPHVPPPAPTQVQVQVSDAGKGAATTAPEASGPFCVDTVRPERLRDFLRLEHERSQRRVAIAVDVRSAGSLPHLLPLLEQLRAEGVAITTVFLDATTDALVRRFSETRRRHPLSA